MLKSILKSPLSSILSGMFGSSGGTTPPPFDYDSNTYWWDFKNTNNTKELTGTDTFALVPDRIVGVKNFEQSNKSFQPLVTTNGTNLNQDTARQMSLNNRTGLANGTTGWFCAGNIYFSTASLGILSIARNASSTPSRGLLDISGSRNLRVRMSNSEGTTLSQLGTTSALTFNTWYSIAVKVELTGGQAVMTAWINNTIVGTPTTLATNTPITYISAFPSTETFEFTFGNVSNTDLDSFDGEIKEIIFYNGVPSNTVIQSILTYINSERPA